MENKKINELLDESRPWDRELLNIVTKILNQQDLTRKESCSLIGSIEHLLNIRNKYTKMHYALEEMRKI